MAFKEGKSHTIERRVVMPGRLDGIDAAQKIKHELDIPIIFLTAYTNDKFIERAKNIGPFGYIVKPLNENEIRANIEITLHKKEFLLSEDAEIQLKEVLHRIKNNLTVISSMLKFQSNFIDDKKCIKVLKNCENRVKSMVLIHDKLCKTKDFEKINFTEYILTLIEYLKTSYCLVHNNIEIKINMDKIFLDVDTAIPCGMIINELFSNSLKYAFPKGQRGEIEISMRQIEGPSLTGRTAKSKIELIIGDNGTGLPEGLDLKNTKTLGMELVNGLTQQLGGDIELDRSNSVEFKITFEA